MAMRTQVAYSPEQYARAVELWERLLNCEGVSLSDQYGYVSKLDDEQLYELILSNGEETDQLYPVTATLISYSYNGGGSDLDVANVRYLEREYSWVDCDTDDDYGYARVDVGALPPDSDGEVEWQLVQLEDMIRALEGLSDYPLLDDELHSEYVNELAEKAWDEWLKSDVMHDLWRELISGHYAGEVSDFGFSDDEIREMYYESSYLGGPDAEWYCEGVGSVVNGRHDEIVKWMADRIVKAWRTPVYDPNQLSLV